MNGRPIPLDEDGRMVLRFHGGEGAYRQFGYASVLRSAMRAAAGHPVTEARPENFRDKIVLVGATAAGLLDLHASPMGAFLPGYVIHAAALDNLLHGDPIRRAPVTTRAALVLGVACGALAMALAWGGSTGYAYVTEGRERRFLRDAFSRYLAPDVVAALAARGTRDAGVAKFFSTHPGAEDRLQEQAKMRQAWTGTGRREAARFAQAMGR